MATTGGEAAIEEAIEAAIGGTLRAAHAPGTKTTGVAAAAVAEAIAAGARGRDQNHGLGRARGRAAGTGEAATETAEMTGGDDLAAERREPLIFFERARCRFFFGAALATETVALLIFALFVIPPTKQN